MIGSRETFRELVQHVVPAFFKVQRFFEPVLCWHLRTSGTSKTSSRCEGLRTALSCVVQHDQSSGTTLQQELAIGHFVLASISVGSKALPRIPMKLSKSSSILLRTSWTISRRVVAWLYLVEQCLTSFNKEISGGVLHSAFFFIHTRSRMHMLSAGHAYAFACSCYSVYIYTYIYIYCMYIYIYTHYIQYI